MSRWLPDTKQRLRSAALDLIAEQGFAATTVPQITARAGLTTGTFFRHYADKREVLFATNGFAERATEMIVEARPSLRPVDVIREGLREVAETAFEGRQREVRAIGDIIRSDEGLRERDLHKRAALAEAIRAGFLQREVDPIVAALLAQTSVTVLYIAIDEWLDHDDGESLADLVELVLLTLRQEVV